MLIQLLRMRNLIRFISILVLLITLSSYVGKPDYGITVFGTEQISYQYVLNTYKSDLDSLFNMHKTDRKAYEVKKNKLEEQLIRKGRFSYVNIQLFKSYSGESDFIIDFVDVEDAIDRLSFRTLKKLNLKDPDSIIEKWKSYQKLSFRLFRNDEIVDMSCPVVHCVWSFNHPKLQPFLSYFNKNAKKNRELLVRIVHQANSADLRAAASFLLAHAGMSSEDLIKVLMPATQDPESEVRNNSMRVIYYIVRANPKIRIDVSQIVKVLNFPSFTDRNKALVVLRSLEKSRFDKAHLKNMLPVLLEILIKGDAHNYRNALQVLKNISGANFGAQDIALWEKWIHEQIK